MEKKKKKFFKVYCCTLKFWNIVNIYNNNKFEWNIITAFIPFMLKTRDFN